MIGATPPLSSTPSGNALGFCHYYSQQIIGFSALRYLLKDKHISTTVSHVTSMLFWLIFSYLFKAQWLLYSQLSLAQKILRSARTVYLCDSYGSQKKQRLFYYTAFTEWFLLRVGN
jgi:hypothetical protein